MQSGGHRLEADGISEMSFVVVIVNEQKGRTRKETFMSLFFFLHFRITGLELFKNF